MPCACWRVCHVCWGCQLHVYGAEFQCIACKPIGCPQLCGLGLLVRTKRTKQMEVWSNRSCSCQDNVVRITAAWSFYRALCHTQWSILPSSNLQWMLCLAVLECRTDPICSACAQQCGHFFWDVYLCGHGLHGGAGLVREHAPAAAAGHASHGASANCVRHLTQ